MTVSAPPTRSPNLFLALLAMLGLLSHVPRASVTAAAFPASLCHAGIAARASGAVPASIPPTGDQRTAGCDACLLCVTLHQLAPLRPAEFVAPAQPSRAIAMPAPPRSPPPRATDTGPYSARAPPAAG